MQSFRSLTNSGINFEVKSYHYSEAQEGCSNQRSHKAAWTIQHGQVEGKVVFET